MIAGFVLMEDAGLVAAEEQQKEKYAVLVMAQADVLIVMGLAGLKDRSVTTDGCN